jgi:hypothetical protein
MRVLADFKESSFAQEQSIVLDWDAHAAQYAAGRQHFYGVGGYGKHTCFQFRKLNYVYATQAMHDMTPSCVSALEARFLLWKWCKLPPNGTKDGLPGKCTLTSQVCANDN